MCFGSRAPWQWSVLHRQGSGPFHLEAPSLTSVLATSTPPPTLLYLFLSPLLLSSPTHPPHPPPASLAGQMQRRGLTEGRPFSTWCRVSTCGCQGWCCSPHQPALLILWITPNPSKRKKEFPKGLNVITQKLTPWGRLGSAHLLPDQWLGLQERCRGRRVGGNFSQCINRRCPSCFILLNPGFVGDWKNTGLWSPVFSLTDIHFPSTKQNLIPGPTHPLGTLKVSCILALILHLSWEEHIYPHVCCMALFLWKCEQTTIHPG